MEMRRTAALLLLLLATNALAERRLVVGEIAGAGAVDSEWIDLIYDVNADGQVLGATWWPTGKRRMPMATPYDLRLVTGTQKGDVLTLQEWEADGVLRGTLELRLGKRFLRGTWRAEGKATAARLWEAHWSESPLMQQWDVANVAYDRMRDAIRAGRWPEAWRHARLACAVQDLGCDWMDALPELAANAVPAKPRRQTAVPWDGLLLERARKMPAAVASHRAQCEARIRTGCLFLADLLPPMPEPQRRAGFTLTCERSFVGCGEVFGHREVALVEAAQAADAGQVQALLRQPMNVNFGKLPLHTPLYAAIGANSEEIVRLLLDHGADPNFTGNYMKPLEQAVGNRRDEIALLLLDRGAETEGTYALWEASHTGNHAVVRKILATGVHPDRDFVPAGSALMAAVQRGDVVLVRELLAHGADPRFTTNHSNGSPIDAARRLGRSRILRMLLKK